MTSDRTYSKGHLATIAPVKARFSPLKGIQIVLVGHMAKFRIPTKAKVVRKHHFL